MEVLVKKGIYKGSAIILIGVRLFHLRIVLEVSLRVKRFQKQLLLVFGRFLDNGGVFNVDTYVVFNTIGGRECPIVGSKGWIQCLWIGRKFDFY